MLPLQDLYHAYRDDWEIQETPSSQIAVSPTIHQTENSRAAHRFRFNIAIFCALPLEADAVRELFEEIFSEQVEKYPKAAGDDNTYTFGNIRDHHIILVHMPGMGKGAASQAASSLRSSYPEIKLALVVGICGGVPSYLGGEDGFILGDVVISDGIVQYDFGRQFPDTFLGKVRPEVPGPKLRRVAG